jgi:hypothetical protein
VLLVLTWLIASLICGFDFKCLRGGGAGAAGKCFHVDSRISVHGREFGSLEELRSLSPCFVPHVFSAVGVVVFSSCGPRPLRVTADHLVFSASTNGFKEAKELQPNELLFADERKEKICKVISVKKEEKAQQYFGLNCPTSNR